MITQPTRSPRHRRALALTLVAAVAALGVAAAAARPMLAREIADAHALVDEGQRALAKGDRGAATLTLERALVVAPRAGFVRTAIAAAQIHEAATPAARVVRLVTSEEWSWLATALGWLAGLSFALAIVRRRPIVSRHTIALSAGFLVAMAGVARSSEASAAVVMADAPARVAPYADATVVEPFLAGTVVERQSEHGVFLRVRSGDGVEGWIPQSRVEPIAHAGS